MNISDSTLTLAVYFITLISNVLTHATTLVSQSGTSPYRTQHNVLSKTHYTIIVKQEGVQITFHCFQK